MQEELMNPTDISVPDYFHKVVDCQWACPAHTPVPDPQRRIELRRMSAYLKARKQSKRVQHGLCLVSVKVGKERKGHG
jgi:hypothetical protein